MLITRLPLSDHDANASTVLQQDSALLLISHTLAGTAKLVGCYWQTVALDDIYTEDKKLRALMRHYQCQPENVDIIPIDMLGKVGNVNELEQRVLQTAVVELQGYFAGNQRQFSVVLDDSFGTPFQRRVWQVLANINYGESKSYAEIAADIGNPKAYRAVAQANGKNPFSIIVPCHRVINSGGKLGGYTGGLDKKRHLLHLEGIEYQSK
ncbi:MULTISPECIES: methylated-DNA--[protein]-cysteine S-methyltransferase [unclassified Psychrobacter]|uniref:methylated-DNA--[protein]-cysteine S-methyltransferase n=1 Tax=unclassified Psychrobacter TaxID=196806 RepID=UPI0018F6986E|nr:MULTISPECIES: methylated-DNA--[protein]-cysteine S-methyltransferase [unclassified Psychrobacter]